MPDEKPWVPVDDGLGNLLMSKRVSPEELSASVRWGRPTTVFSACTSHSRRRRRRAFPPRSGTLRTSVPPCLKADRSDDARPPDEGARKRKRDSSRSLRRIVGPYGSMEALQAECRAGRSDTSLLVICGMRSGLCRHAHVRSSRWRFDERARGDGKQGDRGGIERAERDRWPLNAQLPRAGWMSGRLYIR